MMKGQSILDDTTKQVYGPTTTRHFYEKDVLYNDIAYQSVDTSLYDFENFDPVDQSGRRYQNLGNLGTALFPVFYDLPESIGLRSGFEAYEPYYKSNDDFAYYDTKSSFIDVKAVLGAKNRSKIDFTFTQNIKPNVNFGFDIQRIVADRQLGRVGQGDRNTESTLIDAFTSYESENKRYHLLFNALSFKHRVDEIGGIIIDSTTVAVSDGEGGTRDSSFVSRANLFQYKNAQTQLRGPENTDFRTSIHLYHQYKLKEFLQLYHIMDRTKQDNAYTDSNVSAAGDFYKNVYLDDQTTDFLSSFRVFQNEAGIKGNIGPAFYNVYLKRRDMKHNSYGFGEPYIRPFENLSESYLGGRSRLKIENLGELKGDFEVLAEVGALKLNVDLDNKFFKAHYKIRNYQPSLLSQRYFGNHYQWDNDFKTILMNEIGGELKLKVKSFDLVPSVQVKVFADDYVYFGADQTPQTVGSGNGFVLSHFGLKANWNLKGMLVSENELIYSAASDGNKVVRIPKYFYKGKLYFQNTWFKKTIPVMFGLDLAGRSAYRANAYDPVTQQFYIEDNFDFIERYVTADAFFNARISNVFVFFKWVHLNMGNEDGYFITPYYNGQERVIDFGVRWMFYD